MPRPLPGPSVTEQRGPNASHRRPRSARRSRSAAYRSADSGGQPVVVGQPVAGATFAPPSVLPGGPRVSVPGPRPGAVRRGLRAARHPDRAAQVAASTLSSCSGASERPSPAAGDHRPPGSNGIIGVPATQILFGGDTMTARPHRWSVRRRLLVRLQQRWGLDGNVLFLGPQRERVVVNSADLPGDRPAVLQRQPGGSVRRGGGLPGAVDGAGGGDHRHPALGGGGEPPAVPGSAPVLPARPARRVPVHEPEREAGDHRGVRPDPGLAARSASRPSCPGR